MLIEARPAQEQPKPRRFPIRGTTSRVRTALFGMALFSFLLSTPGMYWALAALALLCGLFGVVEYTKMAEQTGARLSTRLMLVSTSLLVVGGVISPAHFETIMLPVILLLLITAFSLHMISHGHEDAIRSIAVTVFGPLYIGVPLALALQIAQVDRVFLLFGMLAVWMADTGGYAGGKLFGKTKLAPSLSPKKTVEGLFGGIVLSIVVAAIFKLAAPAAAFSYGWATTLFLPALIAILGPVGDLAESALKRDAGVKDSGKTGTGHGGVLDRIDSLLFCLVAIYVYLVGAGRV